MTESLLLLGGAGLPAWIWDPVRAALSVESAVPSFGSRAGLTLRDYAAAALAQAPAERFTIVAHSIGGVVASEIVAMAPDRVAGLLAIAASIPPAGVSFLGALPAPQRYIVGPIMRVAGTRPPASAIRSGLGTGLTDADIARLITDFTPESQRLYRDRVSTRVFPARTGYISTAADHEFPLAAQYRYRDELAPGFVREIPAGHLPMLQQPTGLTWIIEEFIKA